jgi:hypothetical protein
VANQDDAQATWLPVIGKALAYLCLQEALRKDPKKYDTVLKQVKFLQALGLSRDDAAHAAGSSPASVQVMHSKAKTKKAKTPRRR